MSEKVYHVFAVDERSGPVTDKPYHMNFTNILSAWLFKQEWQHRMGEPFRIVIFDPEVGWKYLREQKL